jgi:hypothetical protein
VGALREDVPWQPAVPPSVELPGGRAATRLVVPDVLLTDALAVLAGARSRADAASACLPVLTRRPGVRAAAVVVRRDRRVVVVGSDGYECGTMAAGAELPLDAGLPVTEAVRTGRTVVQGAGPGWVAVPFGRGRQVPGALLLSLTGAPPESTSDLTRLHRLARALGDALQRSTESEQAVAELAAVTGALAGSSPTARPDVVVRSVPAHGQVGGDVMAAVPDGRGGTWLVAADVVGSGTVAALLARSVRAAVRAAGTWAPGPSALLEAVERGIAGDVPPGSFVTAVAIGVDPTGRLRLACAGHPAPLVLQEGRPEPLDVDPGPPLALEAVTACPRLETSAGLPPGAVLLLHTDGLTERRAAHGVRLLDPVELARGLPEDLETAADRLLAAADAVGPAQDDVSVMLARPRS